MLFTYLMDNIFGYNPTVDQYGNQPVGVSNTNTTGISYSVTAGVATTTINQDLAVTGDMDVVGSLTVDGNTTSGVNTGDVTLTAIGSTPGSNGASLTGQLLTLQPANDSFGGVVTVSNQTFAGTKLFTGGISCTNGTDTAAITNAGTIELIRASENAFIDFKSAPAEDFDCRIIQNTNGLDFRTGGNGTTAPALLLDSSQNVTAYGDINIPALKVYKINGLQITTGALADYINDAYATTFTFNGGGNTSASMLIYITKVGNIVTLLFPFTTAISTGSSTAFTSDTPLPLAYRPDVTQIFMSFLGIDNGVNLATPSKLEIDLNGELRFKRDGVDTPYTGGFSGFSDFSVTYMLHTI